MQVHGRGGVLSSILDGVMMDEKKGGLFEPFITHLVQLLFTE